MSRGTWHMCAAMIGILASQSCHSGIMQMVSAVLKAMAMAQRSAVAFHGHACVF